MKCLLCSSNVYYVHLVQHYIDYHKVDLSDKCFQKLLQPQKQQSIFYNCLRCGDFLTPTSYKVKHDFLKHYEQGQDTLFEDKPLDIINNHQILKYKISAIKFGEYYDFNNSDGVVDDFRNNVRSKFRPSGSVLIKCGFIIENVQPAESDNLRPVLNIQYWSTEDYRETYFNGYVFYNLRPNILSKVISNGMLGSSWRFNRVVLINLSVLKLDKEIVR